MPTAARDPAIAAVLRRPFPEQVAFFRGKLGRLVPTNTWRDLWQAEHDKAFMVAGATKAELLADLAVAIDQAISKGTGIGQFRKDFDASVARHGWDFKGGRNWRTRVIYTTNAATSYAAGRLAQLQASPFWIYKHNDSVLHPRPLHLSWDNLVLPREHAFWQTHYPPNGWGCFPAETLVRCTPLLGQRLRYTGEMVELHTLGGHRLAVTPNHPVLTGRGFIAAGNIQTGDEVISACGHIDAALHGIVDDPQPPASASDLFESLAAQGLRIVPMAADDFHGDAAGGEGKIDIAGSDRMLMHVIEVTAGQLLREGGLDPATHGRVESPHITARPAEAAAVIDNAVLAQNAANGWLGNAEPLGDAALTDQARAIQRADFVLDDIVSRIAGSPGARHERSRFAASLDTDPAMLARCAAATDNNAPLFQHSMQGAAATADLFGELMQRNAGEVTRDEIIRIRKFQWRGHVFDFTTATGLIMAGGIVVSNCKCRVVGVSDTELARKLGGNPDKPLPGNWQQIDPKTGAPVGIDEGWAFAPGASVADDTIRAVAGKVAALPPPLAAALGDTIEDARFASALKRVHAQILASAQGTIEQAALLDASGSLVWIKTGGARAVSFGPSEVAQMRGGVLTHNHPSSTSLSPADLQMLISGRLSRIYAVGNDGQSLYSARVVAGVSASELKRESARALKSVRAAFFRRIHSGDLAPELAAQMQSHAVNLVLARRGIIRYHARLPGGTPQWVYDLITRIGP